MTAPTRHAGIEADQVVDTALAMVEEGGAEALSMRKLASEMGVTTNTIYWHIGSRHELVIALIRRLAQRQAESVVTGSTPRERVASAAHNIWNSALAHRNVTALANQVGATTLLELPLEAALVAELEAAGVTGPAARDALRSVLACIAGFLVMTWRGRPPVAPRRDTALDPASLWATVDDPRIHPDTLAALGEAPDIDALFATTLAAVVAAHVPAETT